MTILFTVQNRMSRKGFFSSAKTSLAIFFQVQKFEKLSARTEFLRTMHGFNIKPGQKKGFLQIAAVLDPAAPVSFDINI